MVNQPNNILHASVAENAVVDGSLSPPEALQKAVAFLNSIGLTTKFIQLKKECFLPGLSIEDGEILIDVEAILYPGDLLHEAGHLAVMPAAERATANAEAIALRPHREAEEMMAICWSYAACLHLGLPTSFVFHEEGYKGGGNYIAENFDKKNYFGLPMLQWAGMAYDEQRATENGSAAYPAMINWLRD